MYSAQATYTTDSLKELFPRIFSISDSIYSKPALAKIVQEINNNITYYNYLKIYVRNDAVFFGDRTSKYYDFGMENLKDTDYVCAFNIALYRALYNVINDSPKYSGHFKVTPFYQAENIHDDKVQEFYLQIAKIEQAKQLQSW